MLTRDRAKERARQIMWRSDRAATDEPTACGARSGDAVTGASTDSEHAGASDSNWTTKLWLSLSLIAFVAVSLIGVRLGFGSNGDSRAIFENSVPAILHGRYVPSRSLGNPLYEAVASVLYPLGGLTLVNIYSLLLSLASIAIFLRQLKVQGSPAVWAVAGFVFNPIFLIQATSPTEWAQTTLCFVAAIAVAQGWLGARHNWQLALYAVTIGALVLTRPDFWPACLALFGAVLWQLKLQKRASLLFVGSNAAAALTVMLVFTALNGDLLSLSRTQEMLGEATLLRRLFVSVFGFVNLFGIVGLIALMVGSFILLRQTIGSHRIDTTLTEKLFLLIWPLFIIRFVALPEKLEYILPLIPASLLALSAPRQPRLITAIVSLSLIANSLLSISLFQRPIGSDQLQLAPRLNKGALFQDWAERRTIQNALDPDFLNRLSAIVYAGDGGRTHAPLRWKNYDPGLTSSDGDLVISQDQLYKLDNGRFRSESTLARGNYHRIFVCNQAIVPSRTGWRTMQPPPTYVNFGDNQSEFRCWLSDATNG